MTKNNGIALAGAIIIASLVLPGIYYANGMRKEKAAAEQVTCAKIKMQLFYYYLDPARPQRVIKYPVTCNGAKSEIVMPKWMETTVPEMARRMVWRDPEEGKFPEAAAWQAPVSLLYEYFAVTLNPPTPGAEGFDLPPDQLLIKYADLKARFRLSLDRLDSACTFKQQYCMGESMDGRGLRIRANFKQILNEMDSLDGAISGSNSRQRTKAITSIAALAQNSFALLFDESFMPSAKKAVNASATEQEEEAAKIKPFGESTDQDLAVM